MRTIGILLLSALPILWGADYNFSQKKRADFLENFVLFVLFVREQIRFSGREVLEIFSLALRDPCFSKPIYEQMYKCLKSNENLEKIFSNNKNIRLKKREALMICAFLNGLGKNDVSGQTAHADYYKEQIENMVLSAKKELQSKGRLIISLSVAAAAALFILMI